MSEPLERRGGRGGLVIAGLLIAGVAFFAIRASVGGNEPRAMTTEERYRADPRISLLLHPCPFGKTFNVDTSDMVHQLVRKLEKGTRDPLKLAKAELAAIGEPAVEELEHLFRDAYPDRWRHAIVQNVLAVCALMDGPWGLEIARYGLGHPIDGVRLTALDAIVKHGGPADYDDVAGMLPFAASPEAKSEIAMAMKKLDPERFFADFASWLEEGVHPGAWKFVTPAVNECRDPETVARLKAAAEGRQNEFRPFLLSPAARDGDEDALNVLRGMLTDDHSGARSFAVQALGRVGLFDELKHTLLTDELDSIRILVIDMLSSEISEETTEYLVEASRAKSPAVRQASLMELVRRGHEESTAVVLNMLGGNVGERDFAIRTLRNAWDAREDNAERAYAMLLRAWEGSGGAPASVQISILQSIATVPMREAAELLIEIGRTHEGTIRKLDAFRWCVGQTFNTGPAGHEYLRQILAEETDPIRRLDIITFVWQDHSDDSREVLLEILLDESRSIFERIYCADRLIQIGPATELAPILKRIYLASTDIDGRPALQCLLWKWYGTDE